MDVNTVDALTIPIQLSWFNLTPVFD